MECRETVERDGTMADVTKEQDVGNVRMRTIVHADILPVAGLERDSHMRCCTGCLDVLTWCRVWPKLGVLWGRGG